MKVGDRIKRTKIVPVRWISENHDSDLDGVPNYRDCQWWNPNRQDITPSFTNMDELVNWMMSEGHRDFAFSDKSRSARLRKAWKKRGFKTKMFEATGPRGGPAWTVIAYR